jgi:voltage-gated potassium channel
LEAYQKVYTVIILLALLLCGGTIGYMLIEGLSLMDSFYMTVITISTVGFQEVQELSTQGKLFTVLLIISGLFIAAFAVTIVSSFVIEGEFRFLVRRRLMENSVANLNNHYIICGAGQTGQHVVNQFKKRGVPHVVIEADRAKVEHIIDIGGLAVVGDATTEEDLIKVGIERAKGLVCCLSSDADNVFTVLTARGLKPDLLIVSRAIDDKADLKLLKAGADKVVSPNEIGGSRMASLVLRPAVVSFLDVITRAGEVVIDLEEVIVKAGSKLSGQTLADARIPEQTGLIIMAVKRNKGETIINPGPATMLNNLDALIVLGKAEQVEKLQVLADKDLPLGYGL